MKDVLDAATRRAIRFHADGATAEFYARLRQRRFQSTRCDACGHTPFPPRPFCPACGHTSVTWVDLPPAGTLYAFSQHSRALRFQAPDVLGLVELPGVGLVFSRIDASFDQLRIGMTVSVDFLDLSSDITVHHFRPA